MDIKDAIVAIAIGAAGWAHAEIYGNNSRITTLEAQNAALKGELNSKVIALEREITYMNRTIEAFIRKDVYEVDKLYMFERMKNK